MPFPKDALQVILDYITRHTGTVGDLVKAAMAVLSWIVNTFSSLPGGGAETAAAVPGERLGFAFPVWLIPILLEILQKFLKPKTMMAGAKVGQPSNKAKGAAKQLEKYIASDGKAA